MRLHSDELQAGQCSRHFAAGLLQSTSSLVTKKLIAYITSAHSYHLATDAERALMTAPQSAGYGIGIAFALAIMQEAARFVKGGPRG